VPGGKLFLLGRNMKVITCEHRRNEKRIKMSKSGNPTIKFHSSHPKCKDKAVACPVIVTSVLATLRTRS
jgi:hypothetical protein